MPAASICSPPAKFPSCRSTAAGRSPITARGQLMIYPLIDLRRAGLGVRDLVTALERTVVDLLAGFDIEAICRKDAPGVYVDGRKVASVGLRVRRRASYHGMALNIDVELEPFSAHQSLWLQRPGSHGTWWRWG